jgi:putative spermidine/putrescine transport system permease protein
MVGVISRLLRQPAWLFLVLSAGYLAAFYFGPVMLVLASSFEAGGVAYGRLFAMPAPLRVLGYTVFYAFEVTLLSLLLGLPLAYRAWRSPGRVAVIILFIASVPLWTSLLVRTFAWQGILGRGGVVNWVLTDFFGAAEVLRLSNNTFGAVLGSVYVMIPYMVLALYAGFRSIDRTLLSATRVLGATRSEAFMSVFAPLAMPAIASGCLLVFILSLGFFVPPSLLGGPSDQTVAMFIAQRVNTRGDFGGAAALSVLLLMVTLGTLTLFATAAALIRRFVQRERAGQAMFTALDLAAMIRPLRLVLLPFENSWVWNAGIVLVLALLLAPFVVIVPLAFSAASYIELPIEAWSTRWFETIVASPNWLTSAWNSIIVAAGATLAATLVGLSAALGMRHLTSRTGGALSALFMAPAILPVIVYAVGSLFMFGRFGLVDTVWSLILTHAAIGVPFVVVTLRTALGSVNPSLEGAGRTLGAGYWRVLGLITLPIVAPAMITGALMAFLTSFDEVVIALFLSGVNARTLPKVLWQASTLEVSPVIMAVGLLMVVFMLLLAFAGWLVRLVLDRSQAR